MAEQTAPYTPTEQTISPQPPTTSTATPATPAAASGSYQEMISPKDFRVYRVPSDRVKAYTDYGYVQSKGAALSEKQVGDTFSSWLQGGEDFIVQSIGNAPFVRSAYAATHSAEESAAYANRLDTYAKENPGMNMAANVLGTGVELAGLSAALPAGALTGAGLLGGIGASAATNVALGAVSRFDDAAIHHAADPAGQEKSAWASALGAKDMLADAALGAVLPGLVGGAGKALGWIGRNVESRAQTALRDSLVKERAMIAQERAGTAGRIPAKIDEVMKNAPRSAPGYVKAQILKYGTAIETIKRTVGLRTSMEAEDRFALKQWLHQIAGPEDQIITRIEGLLEQDHYTLDHLQKINQKIKQSITYSDYSVNVAQNDKYEQMMSAVKDGMFDILNKHDASFGKTTASEWASTFNEYSDWSRINDVLDKRRNIEDAKQVLMNVGAKAFSGGLLGGATAAISGNDWKKGASLGAATGAGLNVYRTMAPASYAGFAQKLSQMFLSLDKKATKAVMMGLYGVPAQLHARHFDHPEQLNAALSAINSDPAKAFTNLRVFHSTNGLADKQADDAANRHFAMMTDIAAHQTQRHGGADMPTRSLGDPMQQRKVQALYRVANDPTYALANPTKENMAFAQKHFPQLVMNAQMAITQQLHQNPDLPYAAKRYASRVLGRPVSNSTSPKFAQMLAEARAKLAQAEQQAAQGGPQSRKSVQSEDSSGSGTRLEELQGGR